MVRMAVVSLRLPHPGSVSAMGVNPGLVVRMRAPSHVVLGCRVGCRPRVMVRMRVPPLVWRSAAGETSTPADGAHGSFPFSWPPAGGVRGLGYGLCYGPMTGIHLCDRLVFTW